ncbi:MAG: tetratricopeptide repeat protein [Acidiferrobacterales bacterium]
MNQGTHRFTLALIALVLALSAVVYLPGISGPYVFDDRYNLVKNSFIRISSLDPRDLYHASFSIESGPLLRPLSMLSFALNYYFAGSFDDTTPFKLTNLCIHVINGLLIFWLVRLIFARLSQIHQRDGPDGNGRLQKNDLLAAAVALLWIVHPINLTGVLYIVQRMAALSALFTLLGLVCYLKGRNRIVADRAGGIWLIAFGLFAFGGLGMLSKETTALLPCFMLALEFTLFANEAPWRVWSQLSARIRTAVLVATLLVAIATLFWAIGFALPGYASRPFTMLERVLTESRVLIFYLSLLILPRINQFGLHHDDIGLSSSLFSPWTTLPAVLGIIALLVLACLIRRRSPLLSLGILWFFIGHLMESTILPLEIAHEHRNYLASVGILLALVHLLHQGMLRLGNQRLWVLYPVFAAIFAGTTFLRATQWSDLNSLAHHEAFHHPNSARAQAMLGSLLYIQGDYKQAMEAVRRAEALAPNEAGYKINRQILAIRLGMPLDAAVNEEILKVLATGRPSTSTQISLDYVGNCVATHCSELQAPMEAWLNTLIENVPPSLDGSYFDYLLGRTLVAQGKVLEGLNVLERAYRADPNYLHPLFELANVFLALRQIQNAEFMLDRLRRANEGNLHPRDKEIAELAAAIEKLKNENQRLSPGES